VSTKADYSSEEWQLVLKAPFMAGLAVVAASPSGPLGTLREMFAVGKLVSETTAGASELLRAIAADLSPAALNARGDVSARELKGLRPEQLRTHALEACRSFSGLIDRKATPAEAEELKRWLLGIARRTAEAAKEGGFLGFGGVQVSETEAGAIRELAGALGIAPPA
jgi:hypothetical protein